VGCKGDDIKQAIVIRVLGEDSPGLVESLSKRMVAHQGDWVESRMASLVGQFAVDLQVDQVLSLPKQLKPLQMNGLWILNF